MFFKILTRKKILSPSTVTETRLARVLSTFDLTALGIGSTLGVGVYVLAGKVAKDSAGPAVILSFFIAALASLFAGLCYAEFGSRVPRAGSAYIYSYVCVGEFIAFLIGWNLILEYIIGAASVARGFSLYLDTLINDTLKNTFIDIAPINLPYMSSYFDFFSFGAVLLLTFGLAFGMKESTIANNIFTTVNILVVIFVIIAGSIKADLNNWKLPAPKNITDGGTGGFFPFGFSGVIKGAATCFYGFVGFDCIATTGEEVKNPQKSIPLAILLSLFIVFLSYFGTSAVITLMVPYYLEDVNAPIPHAFDELGMNIAKWIVTIGGMFGLLASLFGAMFPLPRIIYAMASDGLIFKFLGTIHQRFSSPVIGTFAAGILTGLMGAIFEIDQLVNMMSIGTLLAYTIVAACVLLLRYGKTEDVDYTLIPTSDTSSSSDYDEYTENASLSNNIQGTNTDNLEFISPTSNGSVIKQIFNYDQLKIPTVTSQKLVAYEVFIYCILCLLIGLGAKFLHIPIIHAETWAIVLISVLGFFTIMVLTSLGLQPQSQELLTFKVPLTPLIPALSIIVNIYLMLMLDVMTWIRFAVWIAVGVPIYIITVKQHLKAQNNNVKFNHKSNGLPNGNLHSQNENERTHTYSTLNNRESILLTEDAVLANLDKILSKEEDNIKQSSSIDFNRKVSVDTLSTHSHAYYEENVVAIVHREDVSNLFPSNPYIEKPYPIPEENSETSIPIDDDSSNKIDNEASEDEMNNSVPIPPPMRNFELLKMATMPANKIRIIPSIKTIQPMNEDFKDITQDEKHTNNSSALNNDTQSSVPIPPPMHNLELLKMATMPAMRVRTIPSVKTVHLLKDDIQNEEAQDEHTLTVGSKTYDKFKLKLEKLIHVPNIPAFNGSDLTKTNDMNSQENDDITENETFVQKPDIKERLENLYKSRKNPVIYKRAKSENDAQIKENKFKPSTTNDDVHNELNSNDTINDLDDNIVENIEKVKKELEKLFSKNVKESDIPEKTPPPNININDQQNNSVKNLNNEQDESKLICGIKLKETGIHLD